MPASKSRRSKDSVIGHALPRVEGVSKVTGSCMYSGDVSRPGELWGGFLRSPHPHARILNIDVSRAVNLPGIKAVVTGKDVSPRLEGLGLEDMPVMAQDRVRYMGEKVAGIAGIDQDVVEEALGLIKVDYEELPAVFDPLEAVKPEAPVLHPYYDHYSGPHKEADLKNVQSVERAGQGNIDKGFSESDRIFENTFYTQMVHQAFIEPRNGLVEIDGQGRVGVWHCHQAPFMVRGKLSAHADLPEERVVVYPLSTGGSFGGKLGFEDILCNYYLAGAAGRPVRVKESYTEELIDGQPRHPAVVMLRTGVKNDGRLWAWDGKVYYNGGAYAGRTPRNGLNGTFLLAGSYRTPHVRMVGYSVYTNQVPTGFFRAPGEVQTLFAVESHMDMIAEALQLDPVEFRLRNSLQEGDPKPTGEPLRSPRGIEVLERVAKISKWRKSKARPLKNPPDVLTGSGIAFGYRHIGTGESSAELFLEPDGSLRLATAVRDVGVGAYTMHKQVAAEILGVEPDLIQIDVKGTDTGTYDEGVRGQRGTYVEGQAVVSATNSLIELLRKRAAAHWTVGIEEVQWESGRAWLQGKKKESLGLGGLTKFFRSEPIRGYGHCKGGRPDVYVFQALVADVEVERETGQIRVQRLYFALDSSKVVNPLIHQGQIDGAVVQGLGQSLMEDLVVEDGRVLPLSLGDYKIPNINDISPLFTSLVDGGEGPGPFQTKAVAEAGIGIVAPAIANAVYNATGARIMGLPITSQKVFEDLRRVDTSHIQADTPASA